MSANNAATSGGRRPLPLAVVLLFGPAFFAMGLLVAGLLTGHVPAKPGALRVPAAMLWLTAILFCCSGLGLMLARWLPKLAAFFGLMAFCCFVGIFNWIAFGPGERSFTRSITTSAAGSTASNKSAASETEGRLAFGLVAGALDALILYGIYHGLRHRNAAPAKRKGA